MRSASQEGYVLIHLASFFFGHWLWHPLWGKGYQWWSGIGSDIGEITLIAAVVAGYRKINCHARGCPRIGHYIVEGTPYKVCRYHHPKVPDKGSTVEHIQEVYRKANESE